MFVCGYWGMLLNTNHKICANTSPKSSIFAIRSSARLAPGSGQVQFSRSVMSDSVTPWNAARQASLSITNSRSWLKLINSCCKPQQYILRKTGQENHKNTGGIHVSSNRLLPGHLGDFSILNHTTCFSSSAQPSRYHQSTEGSILGKIWPLFFQL